MTPPGSVVVTGGSRGIGRAFVLEAARRGYRVHFTHRGRSADVEATVAAAGDHDVRPEPMDLLDPSSIEEGVRRILREGGVHLLVNNAGTMEHAELADVRPDAWQRSFEVHVAAPMRLARGFAGSLRATRGAILNVSSTGGVVGSVHGVSYGASKAAMLGLTKTLARELAPEVRVNTLAPGPVGTDMYDDLPAEERRAIEQDTPLQRVADPVEIAVTGLDLSHWTYATGMTLVVDGGRVFT